MTRTDEAARWFSIQRRGVMTLEEHAEYESWIASRANRAALGEMQALWSGLEAPPPHLARKAVFAAICASLCMGLLSLASHGGFWTSLDWANR